MPIRFHLSKLSSSLSGDLHRPLESVPFYRSSDIEQVKNEKKSFTFR